MDYMATDWPTEGKCLELAFLDQYCGVVYLDGTSDISTPESHISVMYYLSASKEDMLRALEALEQIRGDLEGRDS